MRSQKEAGQKPNSKALCDEIKRRDESQRPDNWDADKKCKWLSENAYGAEGMVPVLRRVTLSPELTDPPQGGVLVVVADPVPKTDKRWRRIHHTTRLVMAIVEHKDEYIARDAKPANRQELEAADRNGVWIKISETFNNQHFKPDVIQSRVRP